MKEWKASEKEAQKMTRDGAISVNMVTGEASHVSDRAPEQDYSPSGDSTALARTALHHLDDRRVRKSQKKKRRNRRKAYREGTAANSRPSSRLQFTEEERAAPELQKAIRKSDKAADKLDAARAAVPKKRVLGTERVFDEASGTGRTRLVFHETDKPASIRQPGSNPLARPLQRSPTPPMPRCGRWSRRTPAWRRAISPSAAWKKPWAMGTASCKTGGRSGR